MQVNAEVFAHLEPEFRRDPHIIQTALQLDGLMLQHVDENLRERSVVRAARVVCFDLLHCVK